MRRDPVYLVFTITVPSGDDPQSVIDSLRLQITPDSELIDTRVSSEGTETVPYRLGDFFEDIAILPGAEGKANEFRVVFHRQTDAGHFWKDLMIRIVRALESDGRASVSLDYQGNVPLHWMRPLTVS